MKTPLIILVGADKGGVGKTTTVRALSDYLVARKAGAKLFDSQYPAGDLSRFAPADVINIGKVSDQMKVFDTLDGVTVVDICAGLLLPTIRALDEAKLLEEVRAGTLSLALLHVLGPTVASLSEIAEAAGLIGGGVKHFLVKNHVNEGGFSEWDTDARFAEHLRAMSPHTVEIPHLDADISAEVQRCELSFAGFIADVKRSRVMRGVLRSWLGRVWAQFDKIKLNELVASAVEEIPTPPPAKEPSDKAPGEPAASWSANKP